MERLTGRNNPVPSHFSLRFSANRYEYHAIINLMPRKFQSFTGRPWHHQSTTQPCHLTLNSKQGRVLFISTHRFDGDCPLDAQVSLPYLAEPSRYLTREENEKVVLFFNQEACRYQSLVGGKGSSLALLSANWKSLPIDCTVPRGFCLTVNAWQRQINSNKDVLFKLEELNNVGRGRVEGRLEERCEEASNLLAVTSVDSFIQDSVREALHVNISCVWMYKSVECIHVYDLPRNCLAVKLKTSDLPFVRQQSEKMEKTFLRLVRTPPSLAVKDMMRSSRASNNVGLRYCLISQLSIVANMVNLWFQVNIPSTSCHHSKTC